MSEFYFTAQVDEQTRMCVAPLSDEDLELSGESVEDSSGYFLYIATGGIEPSAIEILAQIKSDSAAWRLSQLLGLK